MARPGSRWAWSIISGTINNLGLPNSLHGLQILPRPWRGLRQPRECYNSQFDTKEYLTFMGQVLSTTIRFPQTSQPIPPLTLPFSIFSLKSKQIDYGPNSDAEERFKLKLKILTPFQTA